MNVNLSYNSLLAPVAPVVWTFAFVGALVRVFGSLFSNLLLGVSVLVMFAKPQLRIYHHHHLFPGGRYNKNKTMDRQTEEEQSLRIGWIFDDKWTKPGDFIVENARSSLDSKQTIFNVRTSISECKTSGPLYIWKHTLPKIFIQSAGVLIIDTRREKVIFKHTVSKGNIRDANLITLFTTPYTVRPG